MKNTSLMALVYMSLYISNIIWATISLIAGILFLSNVNRIAQFNQTCGVKLKSFFHKKLGNSPLNRELWSIGTPSGHRSSRFVIRIAGVVFFLAGLARMVLAFRIYSR
jgi:hypothetical protein